MEHSGLDAIFIANREKLLRFLAAHGAGDAAEDLLQELWLRLAAARPGPIAAPLAYLYRAANNLMIDRHRAQRQAARREHDWSEATGGAVAGLSDEPGGERIVAARQHAALADAALASVGARAAAIFRRHRIDGIGQRAIAAEFGVSISTVESDLRRAYQALVQLKRRLDED